MGTDEIILPAGQYGTLFHIVGQGLKWRPFLAVLIRQPLSQLGDAIELYTDIVDRESVLQSGRLRISR
jgi:hypothetical protein